MSDHILGLCEKTDSLDIAIGYFYSDGFNLIEKCLQKVKKIRIIMGQDTSQKTIDDIADTESSLGKHVNDGKVEIRIYETDRITDRKFHGKTWIFNGTNIAIVGSSNCSINGLQKNKELNVIIDIEEVKGWYESIWKESTQYDPKKLRIIKKTFECPILKPEQEESDTPHEYQTEAIDKVVKKLETEDKCKLIMACGTGKTFVSIKIMEEIISDSGVCVYFVPSISLIPQTLAQFKRNGRGHNYHAVCSDKTATNIDDDATRSDLDVESSTNPDDLVKKLKKRDKSKPFVIFTVYNSWKVTSDGLEKSGIKPELVLYDEAHRTTGKRDGFAGDSLHKLDAAKKVFMTATPRVYKNSGDKNVNSMDDKDTYGTTAYNLSFTDAVEKDRLVPFRIILPQFKKSEQNSEKLDHKDKLRAIWEGIKYPNGIDSDRKFLQRMIVFHNTINKSRVFAGTMKGNKITGEEKDEDYEKKYKNYEKKYKEYMMKHIPSDDSEAESCTVSVRHVDSTMSAKQRRKDIEWLKDSSNDETECRILSNARCLQEGVDVPALDGVAFLDPKRSPVDIIQAIGRVMRKDKGKEYGYVMLPIPTFSDSDPESELKRSPTYRMISDIMSALLAHDNKLSSLLNQSFLIDRERTGKSTTKSFDDYLKTLLVNASPSQINYIRTVMIDLVDKTYYPRYGLDLGKKAVEIEEKIKSEASIVKNAEVITKLQHDLKTLINDSITLDDARKVLCQHAVLRPVFDQLFPESKANNPVSAELDKTVDKLDVDLHEMQDIYDLIKNEMSNMDDPVVKQEFIRNLYDSFFKGADSKASTKHGIVYTPVEVVDFILNSVNDVLKSEFGKTFSDDSVKVLDPFTGTGMFVTRLLQSGLILNEKLESKYKHDIHCNDIELLAYYTALANIETTYYEIENNRVPFNNILFTDTFSQNPLYFKNGINWKKQQKIEETFGGSHKLLGQQKNTQLNVIIGNPPYFGGQETASAGTESTKHIELEKLIKDSYIEYAPKGNTKVLYNSYIKAFRWASYRIGVSGVIGFVTPESFISGITMSGVRKCINDEFTDIWCFNLRGNTKLSGEAGRKTGGNIFGSGSREPISITIFSKNPAKIKSGKCTIHYKTSDDYLKTKEKLNVLKTTKSIYSIKNWQTIIPNKYHDWINQLGNENEEFKVHMALGDKNLKGKNPKSMFDLFSNGLKTHRDAWVYNASNIDLETNIKTTIDYINTQVSDPFEINPLKCAWTSTMHKKIKKLKLPIKFSNKHIRMATFRPFVKQYLYFDPIFIDTKYHIPKFFTFNDKNPTIIAPDKIKGEFSTLMTDTTPDLHIHESSQCFPLHIKNNASKMSVGGGGENSKQNSIISSQSYNNSSRQNRWRVLGIHDRCDAGFRDTSTRSVFPDEGDEMIDNITDYALKEYQVNYNDDSIIKEDVFYYTYGILHHLGYREKYQKNLVRGIPRIPMVPDFWLFSKAGMSLGQLHMDYETCKRYDLGKPLKTIPDNPQKIRFGKKKNKDGRNEFDTAVLIIDDIKVYNNLPKVKYVVNEKTPIGWLTWTPKKSKANIDQAPFRVYTGKEMQAMIERLCFVGVETDRIMEKISKEPFESPNAPKYNVEEKPANTLDGTFVEQQ